MAGIELRNKAYMCTTALQFGLQFLFIHWKMMKSDQHSNFGKWFVDNVFHHLPSILQLETSSVEFWRADGVQF